MKGFSRAICCVATQNYLPRLIVLYNSILEHQDIPLYLLVADIEAEETAGLTTRLSGFFPESAKDKVHVIAPVEIYGGAIRQMRYYYDSFELSCACKGGIHRWMQLNTTVERWLYLDSDMLCCGSLEPVFSALATSSILLTPHRAKPGATVLEDMQLLSAGTFNSGVVGVRRSTTSPSFTEWLCTVLSHYCLNDPPLPPHDRFIHSALLFCDQVWMDLVPAYFPGVLVSPERGFNLGHWNADEGRLTRRDDVLYMGEDRVTLLHLSGWLEDQPGRLSRYSSLDWSDNPVWIELHDRYGKSLASLKESFNESDRFITYPDGSEIPKSHRRAYLRHLLDGFPPVDDISFEKMAAICSRYEEQGIGTAGLFRMISNRDNMIKDLREKLDNIELRAALKRFRFAHYPVIGWFVRTLTNCYSNSSRCLVQELLACDDRTFVRKASTALLGRTPDSDMMAYYCDRLHRGEEKTAVLNQISRLTGVK